MSNTLVTTFVHEDGSLTQIHYDEDGSYANPREYDGNVATLIQTNDHCIDIDEDDAGLAEAVERLSWLDRWTRSEIVNRAHPCFDDTDLLIYDAAQKPTPLWESRGEYMVRRYVAMFRPDILHFRRRWSAGDSRGWGYVTRDAYEKTMLAEGEILDITDGTYTALGLHDGEDRGLPTPAECFEQEVESYRQWADGEVYGYVHYEPTTCRVCKRTINPVPSDNAEPRWQAAEGQERDEDDGGWSCDDGYDHVPLSEDGLGDSCWGFLGYDSFRDMASQATDSPIVQEV